MTALVLVAGLLFTALWLWMALLTIGGQNEDVSRLTEIVRNLSWDKQQMSRQLERQRSTIRHMTVTHSMLLDQLDHDRVEWAKQVLGGKEAADV